MNFKDITFGKTRVINNCNGRHGLVVANIDDDRGWVEVRWDGELAYTELVSQLDPENPLVDGVAESDRGFKGKPETIKASDVGTMRGGLLAEADSLVNGDRNNAYGPPHQDFARTAGMLTADGYRKLDVKGNPVAIDAHDVAIMVMLVKVSRLSWTPGKRDSWVDIAGYAACGYEAYELTKGDKA